MNVIGQRRNTYQTENDTSSHGSGNVSSNNNNDHETDDVIGTNSTSSSLASTSSTASAALHSAVVTDIANSIQDNPVQPRNHKFPTTTFNNRLRAFNPLWFDSYSWLEYSIERDAAFCFPCRFFATGIHRNDSSFGTSGLTNWKNAIGKGGRLEKHKTSHRHQHAMSAWSDYTSNISHNRSIASTLNTDRQVQVCNNRHYMKTLLHVIKFCSFQEIALRGHREVESNNKGNFLELLHLVSEHDPVIKSKIRDGPRNATYTSHSIQDELLHILAKNTRLHICNEVKQATYYSIIVDESRDLAKQEQMSFVVRYFNMSDGKIHERFLAFLQAKCLDAANLSLYIKELVTGFDFDLNKLVSQGYDGASVMSGQFSGVQTRVRKFAPFAVYIHCYAYAHVLNLVLVDSVRSVQPAFEFFVLLEALYVFISTAKVHVKKQQLLHPGKQPMELQRLSDTRWACSYATVNAVCYTFDSILLTVEQIADSRDVKKAIEARGLYHQLNSFSFIISLITFDRILTCTKQLSDQLQSSTLNLSLASELVLGVKTLLTEYRTAAYWEKIYDYALEIAKLHDITVDPPTGRGRKRKRPRRLEDSVIIETVGSCDPSSTREDFRCHFFFPILDKFLTELSNRFDQKNIVIMKGVSSCTPSSTIFLSRSELKEFAEVYDIETGTLEVECSLLQKCIELTPDIISLAGFGCFLVARLPAYSTVCELVRIALTIAVTSTESERSFSTMKRIKTRLRTRMTEDRLSDLSILSIEKEVAQGLDDNMMIDEFSASDKNRRIVLF